MTLYKRLMEKTIESEDGCWNFCGADNGRGYGRIWKDGATVLAHRASYEFHCGPISPSILVLHKCDNRRCINPNHLFLGTYKDNTQDMISKGRRTDQSGENGTKTILMESDVRTIKYRLNNGDKVRVIAEDYKITKSAIEHIKYGRNWRHVQ